MLRTMNIMKRMATIASTQSPAAAAMVLRTPPPAAFSAARFATFDKKSHAPQVSDQEAKIAEARERGSSLKSQADARNWTRDQDTSESDADANANSNVDARYESRASQRAKERQEQERYEDEFPTDREMSPSKDKAAAKKAQHGEKVQMTGDYAEVGDLAKNAAEKAVPDPSSAPVKIKTKKQDSEPRTNASFSRKEQAKEMAQNDDRTDQKPKSYKNSDYGYDAPPPKTAQGSYTGYGNSSGMSNSDSPMGYDSKSAKETKTHKDYAKDKLDNPSMKHSSIPAYGYGGEDWAAKEGSEKTKEASSAESVEDTSPTKETKETEMHKDYAKDKLDNPSMKHSSIPAYGYGGEDWAARESSEQTTAPVHESTFETEKEAISSLMSRGFTEKFELKSNMLINKRLDKMFDMKDANLYEVHGFKGDASNTGGKVIMAVEVGSGSERHKGLLETSYDKLSSGDYKVFLEGVDFKKVDLKSEK